jgi:hypothetical protein
MPRIFEVFKSRADLGFDARNCSDRYTIKIPEIPLVNN